MLSYSFATKQPAIWTLRTWSLWVQSGWMVGVLAGQKLKEGSNMQYSLAEITGYRLLPSFQIWSSPPKGVESTKSHSIFPHSLSGKPTFSLHLLRKSQKATWLHFAQKLHWTFESSLNGCSYEKDCSDLTATFAFKRYRVCLSNRESWMPCDLIHLF